MIPGAFERQSRSNDVYEVMAVAVSPVLYGVIHFLAWNDDFPTPLERVLWRVSSVLITCSGLVGIPLTLAFGAISENFSGTLESIFVGTGAFILLLTPILCTWGFDKVPIVILAFVDILLVLVDDV